MSEKLKSQRAYTMRDLLDKPDLILTTSNIVDFEEEEDDQLFGFTNNRNISSAEMMKFLNIEDDFVEGSENRAARDADEMGIAPFDLNFEKEKTTMEDISGDGKVFKSVKREGVGEVIPGDAMVYIDYMGYFEYQDQPFDSTLLRQSSHRVRLNKGELILGLEMGIKTMKKYEIAHFIIDPEYAFGERGCPPRILENQEVMFTVKLCDFVDNAAADTYQNLDIEEKKNLDKAFPKAMAVHATANDHFKRNRIKEAVKGYKKVIYILQTVLLNDEDEQEKQQKALTKAYVNLAVCYTKLKEPRKACSACNNVPLPNAKTHFTLGKALMTLGEFDRAMGEMNKAKTMEPSNYKIIKEIKELNEKMRQYRAKEKNIWSRCFNINNNDKKIDDFISAARKLCEDLINNQDIMRQPLPPGLDERELECFRQEAANLGLSFITQEKYKQTSFYICKPNYENHK